MQNNKLGSCQSFSWTLEQPLVRRSSGLRWLHMKRSRSKQQRSAGAPRLLTCSLLLSGSLLSLKQIHDPDTLRNENKIGEQRPAQTDGHNTPGTLRSRPSKVFKDSCHGDNDEEEVEGDMTHVQLWLFWRLSEATVCSSLSPPAGSDSAEAHVMICGSQD